MKDVKRKVVSGLAWTYAERTLAQLISLIVTIKLARIISPNEYGTIAIVIVFINIADSFAINGLGNSLIQKKDSDHLDFSSVFFFNIFFSIVLYWVLYFASMPIAWFYKNDTLIPVLRVMSLRIPIAAVNSVQQAYVAKRMEFKKFFYATLVGTIISAAIGILMATYGYGVWALVAQYMSNTIIDTVILWIVVKWRPRLEFSWSRMRELYSYGWKVLATSLLINIYGNIQDLIIGKKFSESDLAYSNKGRQFPSLIATNINTSISKVLFPVVSDVQNDREKVKAYTRKAISVGAYILSPILVGLAVVSDSFISVVLSDKWLPSAPYLRVLCMVFLLQPIQTASIQAMKALGESGLYLKLEIIKKIIGLVILVVSVFCFDSVLAIIFGSLLAEIASSLINIPYNKKLLDYKYLEQMKDILATALLSLVMAAGVAFVGSFISVNIVRLLIQIISGAIIYILCSAVTANSNYLYILNYLSGLFNKRKA